MPLHISAAFDSGNILVDHATDPADIQLRIRHDVGDEHMQWFHFCLSGARGLPCTIRITNAGLASYPKAWTGYRTVATDDREVYRRVPTDYVDGALVIRDTPAGDAVWYSYFAPYSHEQHLELLARCQGSPFARLERLGATVDGRDLDRLVVGTPSEGKPVFWIIARQHPGESMAEWWMEGFLDRLLDPHDPLARILREKAVLHIVPNMNPDGSVRGHLRCNAAGANLNREWHAPTLERSPEVFHVLREMEESGVALCLDVHGDEELPYNFIAGPDGIPSWTDEMGARLDRFEGSYERANPDFQRVHGYKRSGPGEANMTMCTNAVAERFGATAMTLEMPFKDNDDLPDPAHGWSPERCMRLGASAIDPLVDALR